MKEKCFLNWSSGKDSMLALHRCSKSDEYRIEKLVTTVNTEYDRVSMHGLHRRLLEAQAKALEIPLQEISLEGNVSMETYNEILHKINSELKEEGFSGSIFGDILLEDLREYREEKAKKIGLKLLFPLWKEDTGKLANEFIGLGYKAIVICTNAKVLNNSFCGRIFDENFLKELPEGVDPCGENGEFHTFVFDGPMFKNPVPFKVGEKVLRQYSTSEKKDDKDCFSKPRTWDTEFWYVDLIPA